MSSYKFSVGDRVRVPEQYGGFVSTVVGIHEYYTIGKQSVTVAKVEPHKVHTYSGEELKLVTEDDPQDSYTKAIAELDKEIDAEENKALDLDHKISKLKELRKGLILLRNSKQNQTL